VLNTAITFYIVYAPHGISPVYLLTLGGGRSAPLPRATDIVSLRETQMSGGLIVVRAGEGMWAEAYDNLDLFGAALGQAKKNKEKQFSTLD
jgi:hypothetical protein